MTKSGEFRILAALLLVLAAVFSFCILGPKFSKPEVYTHTLQSIEAKSGDSLRLAATATVASAGLTLLPDDVATPVADKIADFTGYFLAAMCILYAAKFILPLAGFAVFRIMVPLICALVIFRLITNKGSSLLKTAAKLTAFALVIWMAVPLSVKASDMVYNVYSDTLQETVTAAEKMTEDVSAFSKDDDATFLERATGIVNKMLEALAITVATSCIIPIIVLIFFLWLAKTLLEIETPHLRGEGEPHRKREKAAVGR